MKHQRYELMKKDLEKMKFVLRLLPVGLAAIGIGGLIVYNKLDFEYDQTSITTLADQYENYAGKDLGKEIKNALDMMAPYEKAYDEFKANGNNPTTRANVVDKSDCLVKAAKEMARIKAIEFLGCSSDASIIVNDIGNKSDGPEYQLIIEDGDNTYKLLVNDSLLNTILNQVAVTYEYAGNGTSEVWEEAIKGYTSTTEKIYTSIIKISTKKVDNFKLQGNVKK